MNDFAEKIIQAAFSWVESLYAWIWEALSSGETNGTALWFAENWQRVVVFVILAGLAVDLLVWLLRAKPWRRFARRAPEPSPEPSYERTEKEAGRSRPRPAPRRREEPAYVEKVPRRAEEIYARRPSGNRAQDEDLSNTMLTSVSEIVSKARGKGPEPITLRAPQEAEIEITDEGIQVPEDIPHVHIRQDMDMPRYEPQEEPGPIRAALDLLAQGGRAARRAFRTVLLKISLTFSKKQ